MKSIIYLYIYIVIYLKQTNHCTSPPLSALSTLSNNKNWHKQDKNIKHFLMIKKIRSLELLHFSCLFFMFWFYREGDLRARVGCKLFDWKGGREMMVEGLEGPWEGTDWPSIFTPPQHDLSFFFIPPTLTFTENTI